MGFFGRIKRLFMAMVNVFVGGMEDKYLIELAENELRSQGERLKEAREGLVQYRALVEAVNRQVLDGTSREKDLTARIKAALGSGQRDLARTLAQQLESVKGDLAKNRDQLALHEQAYQNNLLKMQDAMRRMEEQRQALQKLKADVKMEEALAQISETASAFNMNVGRTTDFGEIIGRINERIDTAKGRARVASDLSAQGIEEIKAEQNVRDAKADEVLRQFELEMGLAQAPPISAPSEKTLGTTPPQKLPDAPQQG